MAEDLNGLATLMAIALLMVIGLIGRTVYKGFMTKFLIPSALPIVVAMIGTGSRGGIAAFIGGASVYLLPYWKGKRTLTTVIWVILGLGGVVYMIASNPDFMARWEESYYEGKLSERENIFSTAIEMIAERPMLGWGPIEFGYQLGFREGSWEGYDAHNLFLHLLLEVGLVGTIPFLVGLYICLKSAWMARSGALGLLPLALLVTIVTANLSANYVVWKPQWLILALAVASAASLRSKLGKGFAAPLAADSAKVGNRGAA
jgi:O-antigen ligase